MKTQNMLHVILVVLVSVFIADGGKNTLDEESMDCSKIRIELAIVLDASSSLGNENFTLSKQFFVDIVGDFVVGADKSRIGMITFADDPEILFTLTKFTNIDDIKKAIMDAKFLSGVTAMGAALKLAGTGVLHESRSGVPKVIMLITDGQNNKFPPSVKMATLQKDAGVLIFSFGIGDSIKPDELKQIASPGLYFQLDKFSGLSGLVKTIKSTLCKALIKVEIDTCETEGDISFVIDSKEKAGDVFKEEVGIISEVLTRLEISSTKQRVAVVIDYQGILVPLKKFSNRAEYIQYLSKGDFRVYPKVSPGLLESGILLAEDRTNVAKLIVLIRASPPENVEEDKKAAHALRSQGGRVLTIAMKRDGDINHLISLSSTRDVLLFKDSSFKVSYYNKIGFDICQGLQKTYLECAGKKIDITLVLDCSSSIGPQNWLKQLQFVSRIVQMLDIGTDATRLGVVYFNSEAYVGFPLDEYDNKNDIVTAIRNLPYSEGGTAIGDALKLAHKQILAAKRNDTVSVMILVTDGQSNMGVKPEMQALKIRNEGIHIICIGITEEVSKDQLMRISSTNRAYLVKDFSVLDSVSVEAITKESCSAINNKPKDTCQDFELAGSQEL